MRYARFAIFLSAIMIATGVFLPYVQLGLGGFSFGKSSSMTLYSTVDNYTVLEAAAAKVDVSVAERIADGLLAKLGRKPLPFIKKLGEAKAVLRDVREIREQAHIETLGTTLRLTGIAFLGILLIVAWLVLKSLSEGSPNGRRALAVAILMGLVSVSSAALFVTARESLRLGNEEIGAPMLSMGSGAYMMLLGAAGGFLAALLSLHFERKASPRNTSVAKQKTDPA